MTLVISSGFISGAGRITGDPTPPAPPATTEWGWQGDLTSEQWSSYLAAAEWITLTNCTAEQASAAWYVEGGQLRYDASLAIAAGASSDFSAYLRLAPRLKFGLEGRIFLQRDQVPVGGFLDIRMPYLVDGVQTNWPSLNTNAGLIRVPTNPTTSAPTSVAAGVAMAYIRGMNNSVNTLNNFPLHTSYQVRFSKLQPIDSGYWRDMVVIYTNSGYTVDTGADAVFDARTPGITSANALADNSRLGLDLVIGAAGDGAGNTVNNAKGAIHTFYFRSIGIEE